MLSTKLVISMWFLLSIISEIHSTEYLHFGGTEEENKQAEYYLSADSGADIGPGDEVIRTQRSFWKLLNKGLFGKCENCCNNCNYNVGNGNSMPSLLLPFQPLKPMRPMPLWRPLEPLFGRLKCNNYGTEKYADDSLNNRANPPKCDVHTYSTDCNVKNVAPAPDSAHGVPVESPTIDANFQLDEVPIGHNSYDQSINSGMSAYRKVETLKEPQNSNKNVPHIIYQPIIYVSSQYQGNKALNQRKQNIYDEIPALSLSYTSTNPSVPAVSTVYNIKTHPYTNSVINPSVTGDASMFASDYLPSDNCLLNTPPKINYLSSPPPSTHAYAPMILTSDDQPYRVCPELFQEYQRKLNSLLSHF